GGGGVDFIGLDGRVDRVSGLAGSFDYSGAEFVGSNRESEADERGACGRVGIDRVGALRLRHAAAQAWFVAPPSGGSVSERSIPRCQTTPPKGGTTSGASSCPTPHSPRPYPP